MVLIHISCEGSQRVLGDQASRPSSNSPLATHLCVDSTSSLAWVSLSLSPSSSQDHKFQNIWTQALLPGEPRLRHITTTMPIIPSYYCCTNKENRRIREDKWLTKGHTDSKLQSQNFDLNLLLPNPALFLRCHNIS